MKTTLAVLITIVLSASVCLALRGCSDGGRDSGSHRVAILQYVDHPGLDAARKGIIEKLAERGLKDGENTTITYRNSQGDSALMQNIVDTTLSEKHDLIITLATPISQAIKRKSDGTTPIIFGVITDPVSAGLVESMDKPGGNYTASSDQWPYRRQIELIRTVLPDAKTVGVPWNPSEVNSQYAMKQVRKAADAIGLNIREVPISNLNEVPQAISSLAGKVDVVYIPADNTAMAAAPSIIKRASDIGVPVIAGDPGTFEAGAIAGLGVSYEDLGRQTGAVAANIVLNDLSPADVPVIVVKNPILMLNPSVAQKFRITFQQSLLDSADVVKDGDEESGEAGR